MTTRSPSVVSAIDFLSNPTPLPDHVFRIGEGDRAGIDQLPSLRPLAFFVVGKAPALLPDGGVDTFGMGTYAMGLLIGDACLKLMRPWAMGSAEWLDLMKSDPVSNEPGDIADSLMPLSPKAEPVRAAFRYRISEYLDITLHRPDLLPSIIAAIDALTNERLTQRARAILETGIDPGVDDLWPCDPAGWAL